MKGLTLMLIFGPYGGFHVSWGHLCLGWVSFTIMGVDIEVVLDTFVSEEKKLRHLCYNAEVWLDGICEPKDHPLRVALREASKMP
jgi:hypothetical protein